MYEWVWLEQPFLSEDLLYCKPAGHKIPGMLFGEGSCHLLNNKVEYRGPACSEWQRHSTSSGVFHMVLDCYVPQRAFSMQQHCQGGWKEEALCMANLGTAVFLPLGY